jgi:hypothetical protein
VSEREPEAESTSAADPRHAEFERAYSALDAAHKWRLPCGTVVEDKLYEVYKFGKGGLVLSGDVEECILNFMVDLDSPDMQKLFSTIEWQEIRASVVPLPDVPFSFAKILSTRFASVCTYA